VRGRPSSEAEALSRARIALVVLVAFAAVLLLLAAFGVELGTPTLLVLVCLALVAYVVLTRRGRPSY